MKGDIKPYHGVSAYDRWPSGRLRNRGLRLSLTAWNEQEGGSERKKFFHNEKGLAIGCSSDALGLGLTQVGVLLNVVVSHDARLRCLGQTALEHQRTTLILKRHDDEARLASLPGQGHFYIS